MVWSVVFKDRDEKLEGEIKAAESELNRLRKECPKIVPPAGDLVSLELLFSVFLQNCFIILKGKGDVVFA